MVHFDADPWNACDHETSSEFFFAVLSPKAFLEALPNEGPNISIVAGLCRHPARGGVLRVGGKEPMFDQRFKSDRRGIKGPAPASNAPATTEFGTHATTTVAIVDEAKVHELTSLSR